MQQKEQGGPDPRQFSKTPARLAHGYIWGSLFLGDF